MSRKTADIIGKRFGRLVVTSKTDKKSSNGSYYYKCKCECGKEIDVNRSNLTSGATKSCGCFQKEKARELLTNKYRNLKGVKIGRLLVVEKTARRKGNNVVWKCLCDCGNEVMVDSESLLNGHRVSCGCKQKENLEKARKNFKENELKEGTSLCSLTKKKSRNNISGTKGVYWEKRTQCWVAEIKLKNGIRKTERYKEKKQAIHARREMEKEYFEPILNRYGRSIDIG